MRAVHKMASDKEALRDSALQKLEEFRRLGFLPGLLRGVCNFMGATTGEGAWIGVRNALDEIGVKHTLRWRIGRRNSIDLSARNVTRWTGGPRWKYVLASARLSIQNRPKAGSGHFGATLRIVDGVSQTLVAAPNKGQRQVRGINR